MAESAAHEPQPERRDARLQAKPAPGMPATTRFGSTSLLGLQRSVGNAAVARMLAAKVQRKMLSDPQTEEAGAKALRAWLSPELLAFTKRQGLPNAVRGVLKGFVEAGNFDEEDVAAVTKIVEDYQGTIAIASPPAFDAFVDKLGADGGKAEYVEFLKAMDFGKTKPAIVFGHAVTTAFYDATKHVILLDPWKLKSATEMLDSLTFECQNALQRTQLREGLKDTTGAKTAAVEYESDKKYVEAIKAVHKATTMDELVAAVGVPTELLVRADYAPCKSAKTVPMPPRTEMPEQDKRQSLWWWKTEHWTDEQRRELWMMENHGEGVGSSTELYSH